jgi:hypothetical protein
MLTDNFYDRCITHTKYIAKTDLRLVAHFPYYIAMIEATRLVRINNMRISLSRNIVVIHCGAYSKKHSTQGSAEGSAQNSYLFMLSIQSGTSQPLSLTTFAILRNEAMSDSVNSVTAVPLRPARPDVMSCM